MSVSLSGLAAFHRLDSTSSSDSAEAQALVRGVSSDIPKLTIPGVEKVVLDHGSKPVTFYRIFQDGSYRLSVRYSQFEKLNSQLLKEHQYIPAKFPKKRYSLKQRTSAEVEQRRLELQQYLQALCDLPNVRSSQTFHTFLKGRKLVPDAALKDRVFGLLSCEPCGMTAAQIERAYDKSIQGSTLQRLYPTILKHGYVGSDARIRFLDEGLKLNKSTMRTQDGSTTTVFVLPAASKPDSSLASPSPARPARKKQPTVSIPEARWSRKQVASYFCRDGKVSSLVKKLKKCEKDSLITPSRKREHQLAGWTGPCQPMYTSSDVLLVARVLGLKVNKDESLLPPISVVEGPAVKAKPIGAEPCKFSRFTGQFITFSNQQQDGDYVKAQRLTEIAYAVLYNPLNQTEGTISDMSEDEVLETLCQICKIVDTRHGEDYVSGQIGKGQTFVLIIGYNKFEFKVQYISCDGHTQAHVVHVAHRGTRLWPMSNNLVTPMLLPTASSSVQSAEQYRRVEILWDMENLPCPSTSPRGFVNYLKDFLASQGLLHRKSSKVRIYTWIQHRAPCASVATLQELEFVGVRILTTFRRKKEVVDHCITGRLHELTSERKPEHTTIVVMSSDFDFHQHLAVSRELGFRTVLIHDKKIYSTGNNSAHAGYADSVDHMFLLSASPTGYELAISPEMESGMDASFSQFLPSAISAVSEDFPALQFPIANDSVAVKSNLANLVIKYGKLELSQLPQRYLEEFKEKLEPRALGYRRLKLLIMECNDAIRIDLQGENKTPVLYPSNDVEQQEPSSTSGHARTSSIEDTWDYMQPGHSTTWLPSRLVMEPPSVPEGNQLTRSDSVSSLDDTALVVLGPNGFVAQEFATFLKVVEDDDPYTFQQWLVMKRFATQEHILVHLLGLCCSEGRLNLIRCLVFELRVELDRPYGPDGFTALHHACFRGRAKTVGSLLRMGARPDVLNAYGKTPEQTAKQNQQHHCVKVLRAAVVEKQRELQAYEIGKLSSWSAAIEKYLKRYPTLVPAVRHKTRVQQPVRNIRVEITECGHHHAQSFQISQSSSLELDEAPAGLGQFVWRLILRDISKLQADSQLCFKLLCDMLSICFPPSAAGGSVNGSQFVCRGHSTTSLHLVDPDLRKLLVFEANAVTKTCKLTISPLPTVVQPEEPAASPPASSLNSSEASLSRASSLVSLQLDDPTPASPSPPPVASSPRRPRQSAMNFMPLWSRQQVAKFFRMGASAPKRYEAKGVVSPLAAHGTVKYTTENIDRVREHRVMLGFTVPAEKYPVMIVPPTSPLLNGATPTSSAAQANGTYFDWIPDQHAESVRVFVPAAGS